MDSKPVLRDDSPMEDGSEMINEEATIKALLDECQQKQIILNQHELIMSAVKEAANDPTLEESVRDTVNRVLVHNTFVKYGSPDNLFSPSTVEKNAAAKLSYSESAPLRERVEKILIKKCKEIIDKYNIIKEVQSTEFDFDDENITALLENQVELQKADQLLNEEQELLMKLIEMRKNSVESLLNATSSLDEQNKLLALKAKVEALTFQKNLWLKEDQELPQAVVKLATYWKQKSEKSDANLKKAERELSEYTRLEKDKAYMEVLKEYQKVLQQTKHVEDALEKL